MSNLSPEDQQQLNEWLQEMESDKKREHELAAFGLGLAPVTTKRTSSSGTRRPRLKPNSKTNVQSGGRASDLAEVIMPFAPRPWSEWRDGDKWTWAQARAKEWASEMFDTAETAAWLRVGLDPREVVLAIELRSMGLNAQSAAVEFRGQSAIDRVRAGAMSRGRLIDLFRREGLIA